MRIFGTEKHTNPWIEKGLIPLGRTTGEKKTIVSKRMTMMTDSFFCWARPGVGKTVILKNFYYHLWLSGRPLIIFDPTGLDHRLSFLPNKFAQNLPPGTKAGGIYEHPFDRTKKVAYLNVGKSMFNWEKKYKPDLNTLERAELLSLRFSDGAQDELRKILKTYGPFDTYDDLIDFVNKFPVNPMTAEAYRKKNANGKGYMITRHHKFFKEGAYMNQQSKLNLLRILYKLSDEKTIGLDETYDFDILSWVKAGNSVVFSFDRNYDLTRAVVSIVAKKILRWKSVAGYGIQPWFIFEEMDKVFPEFPKEYEKEIVDYLSELILQLRKLSLGIGGASASPRTTNKTVIENAHNVIVGKLTGRNLVQMKYFYNQWTADKIKNLHWNRHSNLGSGQREVLYIDEFNNKFVIEPFESPCEIHREIRGKIPK
jgi:hypothetical protein